MSDQQTFRAAGAGCCLAAVLLLGCSSATRHDILSIFFDGVVQEKPPPKRRIRRDLLREIEELKEELARARAGTTAGDEKAAPEETLLAVEKTKIWSEAADLLPKDADGNVDWSEALRAGTIAPRPGRDAKATDEEIFPLDVERVPQDDEAFTVVFSHEAHTAWLACSSCHPDLFEMEGGATPMSMDEINEGKGCGVCHGTVAFPATACGRCHPALAEE